MSSDARLHRLLLHGCNALWHTQQTELSQQHWLCRLPNTFTSLLLLVIHVLNYLIAITSVVQVGNHQQTCLLSMQPLVQTMSWVSALYRSSPAPVLSPSPGSPNTTLNGLWAALDCATGTILWETPSPLTGAMAVSPERDFICLCEAQKVSCCLLVLQNPVGDSQSSCKKAASLKGALIIHNNNNDDSFQLMYVNRQVASCCLLDNSSS